MSASEAAKAVQGAVGSTSASPATPPASPRPVFLTPTPGVVRALALAAIAALATTVRLFSVIKHESVIHEFDPYFNYRVTERLTRVGPEATWNFFDDFTWYPLGRVVGGTMYPGLIFTAGGIWRLLRAVGLPTNIREVCVFIGPAFSGLTALATYGLAVEVRRGTRAEEAEAPAGARAERLASARGAGLAAAFLVSVVPSYVSRSVAGSYDLESISIFALVLVFFLYCRTLNTGSLADSSWLFLAYGFMVSSWGGYSFIANIVPIHALACLIAGRVSARLYAAFAPFVVLGTLACLNVPVIGFNAVLTSEHFAGFLVAVALHVVGLASYLSSLLPARALRAAKRVLLAAGASAGVALLASLVAYVAGSPTFGWTGRSLSLLDPTYASKHIPIIASVSEHQPPTWSSYFTDLHVAALLAPAGLIACFNPLDDASLFLALYGVTAAYFSGVMVRLMLVLAPAACCLAGVGLSDVLGKLMGGALGEARPDAPTPAAGADATPPTPDGVGSGAAAGAAAAAAAAAAPAPAPRKGKKGSRAGAASGAGGQPGSAAARAGRALALPRDVSVATLAGLFIALMLYVRHSVYVASEMYSAPSVVLSSRRAGQLTVIDDFREAYAWLNSNTPEDAVVASWWDYGYQTTAMANRTVVVDNNTWNNTHIATVGRAMALPEAQAAEVFRSLDVGYVFVVFGSFVGYPSDDINKFLWMVRIGGGVFPDIKEADYLSASNGAYTVDSTAGKALLDSLVYRLSYYRFAETGPLFGSPRGYDRVRQTTIGLQDFELEHFEEVFTSDHWMVRVYRVKPQPERDGALAPGAPARQRSSSRGRAAAGPSGRRKVRGGKA